ncbi:MAG: metallopeptidase TldD-related protein [Propionibacteriaceae bacterium]
MTNPSAWVEQALSLSRSDDCVVLLEEQTEANLRWAGNVLTTNGQMHRRTLTVIAFRRTETGVANGAVSGPVASADDLEAVVRAAERAADSAPDSEDAIELITAASPDPDFTDPAVGTTIEVFADFAPALGRAFSAADSADHHLYGFAEHIVATTWLGDSRGVRKRHVQPTGRIELNLKSTDMARSAWVGEATRDFTDIDAEALYAAVVDRHAWSEVRLDLPAGRYETLLPPSAVADLMICAYWSSAARDAEEGRSVWSARGGRTRIGEQLSTLPIRLSSDPNASGMECAPFVLAESSGEGLQSVFDNGAEAAATDWIRDGRLVDLVRTRAHAAKTDLAHRPSLDNLIMDAGGTTTLAEMIKNTERGLLLTCLWYIREVDPETLLLTGLTRDGVYLVENGKVVGAVNNFRFNESPIDLLGRITEASAPETTLPREWNDWFTRTRMPAVRVPDFNMSTVSKAS